MSGASGNVRLRSRRRRRGGGRLRVCRWPRPWEGSHRVRGRRDAMAERPYLRAALALRFGVGSMTDLDLPAASVAGLLAWQSLIHIPDDEMPTVFGHFHRTLRPGGPLQLLFHVGDKSWLKTHGYGGHEMKVHVHRRQPGQVAAWLRNAGFTVEAQLLLGPEESVPQAILFARPPT